MSSPQPPQPAPSDKGEAAPGPLPLVEVLHTRLDRAVSAGPLQTSRLRAPREDAVFFGSGAELLLLRPAAPARPVFERGTQGPSISRQLPLESVGAVPVAALGSALGHEIMAVDTAAVAGGRFLVAAADASGRARAAVVEAPAVSPAGEGREDEAGRPDAPSSRVKRARTGDEGAAGELAGPAVSFERAFPVEAGWCGAALSGDAAVLATAAQFGKRATLYDVETGRQTASLGAAHGPCALAWMAPAKGGSVLAVANSNLVSVWDPRQPRWAATLQEGSGPLHCLATLPGRGLLAAAGVDKSLTVYDSRKWSKLTQRGNAMKFEVTALHFSQERPELCYVAALDHQVTSTHWDAAATSTKHHNTEAPKLKREGYRADSRWVGLDLVRGSGADTLVGVTAHGHLNIVRHPYRLGTHKGSKEWDAALHP